MEAITIENLKEYLNDKIAMIIEKRNNLDCQEDCRHQVFERLGNCINAIKFIRDNFDKEFVDIRDFAEIWDTINSKNNGKVVDFVDWLNPEHKEDENGNIKKQVDRYSKRDNYK